MSTPAVVPWVNFDEFVIGANEPNGEADVDNRPLMFVLTQSDFDPDDAFPGFMVRYTGSGTPEGTIDAGSGHAYVDTLNGAFYVKTTASGNTGWVAIGGNASGTGSPEGVVTGPIGKIYEQRDAASAANAVWYKATGTGNTGWRQFSGFVKATDNAVIATGTTATFTATVTNAVGIGNGITVGAVTVVAIGNAVSVSGARGVAIGSAATVASADAVAIGTSASVDSAATAGIAIGQLAAVTLAVDTMAIGHSAAASATNAIAIGKSVTASATGTVAVGVSSSASGVDAIAVGNTATNAAVNGIVIGETIALTSTSVGSIHIGHDHTVGAAASAIAIGRNAVTGTGADQIVIGRAATGTGTGTNLIAIGQAAAVAANDGIGLGRSTSINSAAVGAIAIGQGATVAAGATTGGIVIGLGSTSATQGQIVIGRNVTGQSTGTGSIYIGDGITVTASASSAQVVIGRSCTTGTNANNVLIGNSGSMVGGSGVAIAGSITVGGSSASIAILASITSGSGSAVNLAGTISGTNGISIGSGSSAAGTSVGIGSSASTGGQATGTGAVAIGAFCTATAGESVGIGFGAGSSHAATICFGRATSLQANEFVVGGGNGAITRFRFNDDTRATPTTMTWRQENASGSNIAGASWTLIASRNTGTGAAGQFIFQVGASNGTATTLGVATTSFIIDRTVVVGATVAPETALSVTTGTTATGAVARTINAASTLTAAANGDVLAGIRIAPTFTVGAFTGTVGVGLEIASISGAATNFAIRSATARSLFGTTTVDTFNTAGIVVQQGGADDAIISLKSSDVAHGMTSLADTDTYLAISKLTAGDGCPLLRGFCAGTGLTGMIMQGLTASAGDATKSASGVGIVRISAAVKSGTTVATPGANINLLNVDSNGTTRFILDADGDSHQDVGTAWTNFDEHDDIVLLNQLAAHVTRESDPLRGAFADWMKSGRSALEKLKLASFNDDGHHFVNMSRLTMLHTGALRQLGARFDRIEKVLMDAKLLPRESGCFTE